MADLGAAMLSNLRKQKMSFSCFCLNDTTSSLINEIVHARQLWQLVRLSQQYFTNNLYFRGLIFRYSNQINAK